MRRRHDTVEEDLGGMYHYVHYIASLVHVRIENLFTESSSVQKSILIYTEGAS